MKDRTISQTLKVYLQMFAIALPICLVIKLLFGEDASLYTAAVLGAIIGLVFVMAGKI